MFILHCLVARVATYKRDAIAVPDLRAWAHTEWAVEFEWFEMSQSRGVA